MLCTNLNRSNNKSLYSTSNGYGTLNNLNSGISQSLGLAQMKMPHLGSTIDVVVNYYLIPMATFLVTISDHTDSGTLTIFRQARRQDKFHIEHFRLRVNSEELHLQRRLSYS